MNHPYISKNKQVLLDANLLTVLIVSQLGAGEIELHKKTSQFTTEDGVLLMQLLKRFKKTITTPQVITETANLLDWMQGKKREVAFGLLRTFVHQVDEYCLSSKSVSDSIAFLKLGLTDAALYELTRSKQLVLLTVDLDLYGFVVGHKLEAINFNHFRNL